MHRLPSSALALVATLAACDDAAPTPAIDPACNPLGGTSCLLPWPSSVFLEPDATTATGLRLALDPSAMPVNGDGRAIDVAPFDRWDGFAPSGPILAMFPSGVSGEGLPPPDDPARSLAADAPIVLLDPARRERAPFFAEIDQNVRDPADRALIIRPLVRLRPATRYVVALRTGLRAADGSPLAPPPGFAALRAGDGGFHPRADLAGHEQTMRDLAAAGVPADDVVLAWDFVTASDEMLTGDLHTMRELALATIGPGGANLRFALAERPADPALVLHAYVGTFTSPDFLTDGEADASVLRRDLAGRPFQQGLRDANLAVIVPRCAETAPLPLPAIVFGHGHFGSAAGYLDDAFVQRMANEQCFVIVAGDFIGLTDRQIAATLLTANDLDKAGFVTEKLAQSVIDFIALEHLVRGPLRDAPALRVRGAEVIDGARVSYLGGSLGGIMGGVFMAYDPAIRRGVLGVPGAGWTLLLERSIVWSPLEVAAQGSYTDPRVYQVLIALLGMRFEPYDPITTAAGLTATKQILMYEAIGDCLVNNYASETLARTMGLPLVTPSVTSPWGLAPATAASTSGFTVYDEHPMPLPPVTTNAQPATDNGTHSGVNRRRAVLDAMRAFVLDGDVVQACRAGDGAAAACDCATGACGDRR